MTSKNCTVCEALKPLSEFGKRKASNDGLQPSCKTCQGINYAAYKKTKRGLVALIYSNQRSSSRQRGHNPPPYLLSDLWEWCFAQAIFHALYKDWVASGFNKWLRPSCDRLDDYQGYSLERLQLMTWQENFDKGQSDRKNGINNKDSKAVIQMTLNGEFINEFYSSHQASRDTGINQSCISQACLGKQKTSGSFRWAFV